MFVSALGNDLGLTRKILEIFEGASGLGCNLQKCQLVPMSCSEDDVARARAAFPCTMSEFPIKYLGVPLSVKKLPKTALKQLIEKVADRLPCWRGQLMHQSGRLALIKSTLCLNPDPHRDLSSSGTMADQSTNENNESLHLVRYRCSCCR